MTSKFIIVFVAIVALAHSSVVPVVKVDNDVSSFAYDVADPNTGDYKSQVETRSGGVVMGQYSLIDPDGTRRVVDYTADDHNGFNAVVRKDPLGEVAPVVAASPNVVAASPAVIAPSVVAARTIADPFVYSSSDPAVFGRSYAVPSVYSSVYPSSIYAEPSVYSIRSLQPSHSSISSVPSSVYARYSSPYYSPYGYEATPLNYW